MIKKKIHPVSCVTGVTLSETQMYLNTPFGNMSPSWQPASRGTAPVDRSQQPQQGPFGSTGDDAVPQRHLILYPYLFFLFSNLHTAIILPSTFEDKSTHLTTN